MKIFGLTGGIGSGKSEVAKRLAERGLPVIDADLVGHEILLPGGTAERPVLAAFGDVILTDGRIDRQKLASVVFGDDAARKRLNAIVHPLIGMAIAEQCAKFIQDGCSAIVVEATLLAEDDVREPWLDGLILVVADEARRLERLVRVRGMDEEDARRRIAAQTPPANKMHLADWVIENNEGVAELNALVDRIADAMTE